MKTLSTVCCVDCDEEFETTSQKRDGELFECTYCGALHEAAFDWDENDNLFWYPRLKESHK